ncbi:tripartite tricarboxylate transporter TctB family protein [Pseudonocardia sp. HH130630-07]|uniref:tripartite tricarboxylate transporter TctB family protein n=1 Tax=Pseudonocardia sp. HH130630-07 TaxID=1690815 RepID=UPI000814EF36|nr:tripartite tricarboxylate transporter TctB family protein [Pseudonocardia sp. HH130630-07]ANY05476.1 hypothetical protein AFB00_03205 [Pseudonocardia sp. HH130630-07]
MSAPVTDPTGVWLRRRSGLLMPAVLLAAGVVLAVGTLVMEVPSTATAPGPQVFPAIAALACTVLAVLLAVDVVRRPEPATAAAPGEPGTPGALRPRANRRALAEVVGTVVVFVAALQPVGWLLAAAFLFWGTARALGSRRPVFDVFVALSTASAVQLLFSGGLGLTLPPGLLAGIPG